MKLSELSVDHNYYCSEGAAKEEYETWNEYLDENKDMDADYTLLVRWDINDREDEEGDSIEGKCLELFFVAQRKGYLFSHKVLTVTDNDADSICEWLSKKFEHLKALWQPFN